MMQQSQFIHEKDPAILASSTPTITIKVKTWLDSGQNQSQLKLALGHGVDQVLACLGDGHQPGEEHDEADQVRDAEVDDEDLKCIVAKHLRVHRISCPSPSSQMVYKRWESCQNNDPRPFIAASKLDPMTAAP